MTRALHHLQGTISPVVVINAGVVQGSVIGPAEFIICTADLKPASARNRFQKYADDSYLFIRSNNFGSVQDELKHITAWADTKHLLLKLFETREMVVVRPRRPSRACEAPVAGGRRESSMTILCITIDEKLFVSGYVNRILAAGSSSMYALKHCGREVCPLSLCMKSQESPWSRNYYLSKSDLHRLEGLFHRAKRHGFIPEDGPSFESLALQMDRTLFQAIFRNPDHVLRHLCRERPALPYTLHPRPHPFVLLTRDDKNFLP